ncbi:MAG: quinoprotein dehydrogenase-associated putative ABC transporter substrate-binding protein [Steroidobacteraceae bacterium]
MSKGTVSFSRQAAILISCWLAACGAAHSAELKSLTVCADPGNMPLSNQKGEGFENKIAQVVGSAVGTGVQYYWRPSIERGLMRTTLSEGNCDLWMDMAADTEGAVILAPLYRSTFVLAYRSDRGINIKTFDDPAMRKLRIGVFQVSAIREALSEHHIVNNTVIHYLSHNADIVAENQPSYQVQQVIDGSLDVAAAWGPMAGYYKKVLNAPLIIQPVNMIEDQVPMEFDMSLAVPRGRPDIKSAVEEALVQHKSEIHQILVDFGVPLVRCDECTVSGDLPSHGPYAPVPAKPEVRTAAETAKIHAAAMAALKKALAQGASPDDELNAAVIADDVGRIGYLLAHGANSGVQDGDGYTPLIMAIRTRYLDAASYLVEHKADANEADRTGWTPLMWAAWVDNPALINLLMAHGAALNGKDNSGLTALAVAAQNGRVNAAQALMEHGADVNEPVAQGGYTPLMLASIAGSPELVTSLLGRGAKINAANPGGVTALMIAVAGNHSTLAALLVKSGADVNARSEDGRTALSIAQENSNDAVIKLLQEAAQRSAPTSG